MNRMVVSMVSQQLTKEDGIAAVYGGCILGGGGGGWIHDGLKRVEAAFNITKTINLISIDDLQDTDYVACVSLVGAPSAKDRYVDETHYISTVKRLQQEFPHPIKALITNENGAGGSINGWVQSAELDIPILDAPCNGRAHPTGTMGSLNLTEKDDYISIQSFSGGRGYHYIDGIIKGELHHTSQAIRQLSVLAGGLIAVCRNPVDAKYVKEHAAIGGISQAIELGKSFLAKPEGPERIEAALTFLNGTLLKTGKVTDFKLENTGGFDVGTLVIDDLEVTFWNEYMTAEMNGKRVGTFPDLIMTFDAKSGRPLVSAEITLNMEIAVISVPKDKLKLGSTMFNETLLRAIEPIIQKQIL